MKLAVSALLIASVAGFSDMQMTFSLSKKPAATKPAPKVAATKAVPKKVVVVAPAPKAVAPAAKPVAAKVVAKPAPAPKAVAPAAKPVVAAKVVAKPAPKAVAPAPKVVAKPAPKAVVAAPKAVVAAPKKVVVAPKKVVVAPKKVVVAPKKVVVAPKKVVVAPKKVVGFASPGTSQALPWTTAPAALDGSMLGDFGFDPLGLSTPKFGQAAPRPEVGAEFTTLNWYREAELMHGRIAQLAVVGFIWPGLFGTFAGNAYTGLDAYSYTNPLEAVGKVPGIALLQIVVFMSYLEVRRIKIIKEEGKNYMPGDQRIGQTGYNPFGLNYTPAEYEEKRLQELKHCRLAMIGIFGLWAQATASGVGVVEQLGAGLTIPAYAARAGYFLPEGI